jgi:hypothetical protein
MVAAHLAMVERGPGSLEQHAVAVQDVPGGADHHADRLIGGEVFERARVESRGRLSHAAVERRRQQLLTRGKVSVERDPPHPRGPGDLSHGRPRVLGEADQCGVEDRGDVALRVGTTPRRSGLIAPSLRCSLGRLRGHDHEAYEGSRGRQQRTGRLPATAAWSGRVMRDLRNLNTCVQISASLSHT